MFLGIFSFMICSHIAMRKRILFQETLPKVLGKSMCISEVHGGAGLGCGPASAHYIAEQVLGYGCFKVVQNHIMSRLAHNFS